MIFGRMKENSRMLSDINLHKLAMKSHKYSLLPIQDDRDDFNSEIN